jgi:hypothetical protein
VFPPHQLFLYHLPHCNFGTNAIQSSFAYTIAAIGLDVFEEASQWLRKIGNDIMKVVDTLLMLLVTLHEVNRPIRPQDGSAKTDITVPFLRAMERLEILQFPRYP